VTERNGQPGTPPCKHCGYDLTCDGCTIRDNRIIDALSHLEMAIMTSTREDNQIIMKHVREAARILFCGDWVIDETDLEKLLPHIRIQHFAIDEPVEQDGEK